MIKKIVMLKRQRKHVLKCFFNKCINDLIMEVYFFPCLTDYINFKPNSNAKNCYFSESFIISNSDTSSSYWQIINFKKKINFLCNVISSNPLITHSQEDLLDSNELSSYNKNTGNIKNENLSGPKPNLTHSLFQINSILKSYCLELLSSVIRVNSGVISKYILFNRGDINKLIKIEDTKKVIKEKNDYINLIVVNLGLFIEVVKDFKCISLVFKTKVFHLFEKHLISLTTLLSEYFKSNMCLLKIAKENINLIKELKNFKLLYLSALEDLFGELLKELGLEQSIGPKTEFFMASLNKYFCYE
mmetsp:Transcript_29960/g.31117  ORF Transcript_29960/g.31117 Transcript_29960/m.31117 type:complete len:302 (+) Transcript_29960:603-1508(+)